MYSGRRTFFPQGSSSLHDIPRKGGLNGTGEGGMRERGHWQNWVMGPSLWLSVVWSGPRWVLPPAGNDCPTSLSDTHCGRVGGVLPVRRALPRSAGWLQQDPKDLWEPLAGLAGGFMRGFAPSG